MKFYSLSDTGTQKFNTVNKQSNFRYDYQPVPNTLYFLKI
jgi:hypothetical protein